MTPEQLHEAITDNSVDPSHNSYGSCGHGVSFAMHCGKCAMEQYSISQRAPGWFEARARTVPEQIAAGVKRLQCTERRLRPDPFPKEWIRHTVDISDPAPKYVEDELVAFEKGWRRVKYASLLLLGFVLGLGFGYWVLPQWVHHG